MSKILSVYPFMSLDLVNPPDVRDAMKSLNKFRYFMSSRTSRDTQQEKISLRKKCRFAIKNMGLLLSILSSSD